MTKRKMTIEQILGKAVSDNLLLNCLGELIEFKNTGILCDGKTRKLMTFIKSYIFGPKEDVPIRFFEHEIFEEAARRWMRYHINKKKGDR